MAQPFAYSVRQLLLDLGLYVNDATLLIASDTAPDTTSFVCNRLIGQSTDGLVASEFFPWDKGVGAIALDLKLPFVITGNDDAGKIVLDHAAYNVAFDVGNRGVLQNINGRGYSQEKKEFALRMACMDLNVDTVLSYQAIASPSTTDYWNDLPAALRSVYRIAASSAATGQEYEIMPATWSDRIDLAGWRVNLPLDWQSGDEVRVYGRIDTTAWWDSLYTSTALGYGGIDPDAYAAIIPGDSRRIIQAALPYLLDGKRDDKAAEMTQFAYSRSQREMRERPLSNEVFRQ